VSETLSAAQLVLRPIRGVEEAEVLESVHRRCTDRDGVDPLSSVERLPDLETLRSSISTALALGRQERWTVAEVGHDVAGYSRISVWPERDGTWVYLTLGWVVPEWRGKGIATAMLRRAEDQIRRLAATEHPGKRAEFAANASSTEHEATELLLHEGYRAAYTLLEMGLGPRDASPAKIHALPPGVEIRPSLPEHIPLIAECVNKAYQAEYEAGHYDSASSPDDFADELRQGVQDPTLWKVAWAGGAIVGQVLSVIERGRAEVFEVSVLPAWRRRGLASCLLVHALREIRSRGVTEIRLHTRDDFRTRARDLYAQLGFQVLKEFPRYRKPLHRDSSEGTLAAP
jgi:ribosomal protein S18 acetylase RimI-like enzyme